MNNITKLEMANNWEGFYISTDEGVFSISRVDENFYFKPEAGAGVNDRYLNQRNSYTFKVKDNSEIYDVFDGLYNAVKQRKPYSNSIYDFDQKDYILPEHVDLNKENKLLVEDKIKWHSDEGDYDKSSILVIEKGKECYEISFIKSAQTEESFPTFTVKVSVASQRYHHFSTTFMSMYQNLDQCYVDEKGYQRVRK